MAFNGGKAQVNVTLANPFLNFPFINACKAQGLPWLAVNSTDNAWHTFYDSNGYPTQMPNGASAVWETNQLWMYGQDGDVWVLDWPGTATLSLAAFFVTGSISANPISANRIEYTLTGGASMGSDSNGYINAALLCRITISTMGANTFADGDIRFYPKSQESLLNAGHIFNPNFASVTGPFGCLRSMNWCFDVQQPTISIGQYGNRKTASAYSYFSFGDFLTNIFCGASTNSGNDYSVSQPPSAIGSWAQGQMVQWYLNATPTFRTPSAATNASMVHFTDNGHGLSNGDKIYFGPGFGGVGSIWNTLTQGGQHISVIWPVTVIDANVFSVAFDSTSAGAWPNISYAKVLTLKVGSLSPVSIIFKPFAGNISQVAFSGQPFVTGDIVTGVYDVDLGYLMTSRDDTNGTSPSGMSSLFCGVPFDVMIAFCNQNGCHPWICIPPFWDDASVTSLANLLISTLDSTLIPRIEWSNEVWNFDVTGYAEAKGEVTLSGGNFQNYYGKRISEISALFKAAYAGSGLSYEIIMGVQSADLSGTFTDDRFKDTPYSGGIPANYPINQCDAIAHAPYFAAAFNYHSNAANYPNGTAAGGWADQVYNFTQGGAARQTAFDWYRDECINNSQDPTNFPTQQPIGYNTGTVIPFWMAQATMYGKKLYEYEGGQTVASGGDSNGMGLAGGFPITAPTSGMTVTAQNVRDFYNAFMQSSQFAYLTTLRCTGAASAGEKFPSQYTCMDSWANGYYWGIYPINLTQDGIANNSPTPAYTALRFFNDPTPTSSSSGVLGLASSEW